MTSATRVSTDKAMNTIATASAAGISLATMKDPGSVLRRARA